MVTVVNHFPPNLQQQKSVKNCESCSLYPALEMNFLEKLNMKTILCIFYELFEA